MLYTTVITTLRTLVNISGCIQNIELRAEKIYVDGYMFQMLTMQLGYTWQLEVVEATETFTFKRRVSSDLSKPTTLKQLRVQDQSLSLVLRVV